MKYANLLYLCFFMCLCGCGKNGDDSARYMVLLGESSSPAYDEVRAGALLRDAHVIMVYGEDSFGAIAVYWDGKFKAEFSSGRIVLMRNSGQLAIKGNLKKELLVYVLERVGREEWKLCEKRKLPKGGIGDFQLSLPF